MMADMLKKDLLPLLVVFMIFISSFGVAFQGLLNPNNFEFESEKVYKPIGSMDVIKDMFRKAFYSMFEVSIMFEGLTVKNKSYPDGFSAVEFGFLVIYTGIVNVILINLLIALFSNTVSRIDQRSTSHWLAERYQMVMEYHDRSVLPPPFNILSILYEIFFLAYNKYSRLHCNRSSVEDGDNYVNMIVEDLSTDDDPDNEDSEDFGTGMKDPFWSQTNSPASLAGKRGAQQKKLKEMEQKKKNEKRKRSRKTEKFQTLNDLEWFACAKIRESDICLRFILVQSFSLKDKRHTLGFMTSASSLLAAAGGTDRADRAMGTSANIPTFGLGTANMGSYQSNLGSQLRTLGDRINSLELKLDTFLSKLESQEPKSPCTTCVHDRGRLPRQLSPERKKLFEAPAYCLPNRSMSNDRVKVKRIYNSQSQECDSLHGSKSSVFCASPDTKILIKRPPIP
ncbi:hypothetical protein Ciccas_011022 [Cichlidogyrus casuarinus]|uniref:Ion transport domain-containing protein n=1 Tax=Cichlidogyrus casuarinus TaxID=1844966 RepID=A0ABD2PSG4_9PLAT